VGFNLSDNAIYRVVAGSWNATTNVPDLTALTPASGTKYIVSVGGTQDLGLGPVVFDAGDYAVYIAGTGWIKDDTTPKASEIINDSTVTGLNVKLAMEGMDAEISENTASRVIEAQLLADTNISLTGEQTIDGVLTTTDIVAVIGQTTASENGVYNTAVGAWQRVPELTTGASAFGRIVTISSGTNNGGSIVVCTTETPLDIVGTNNLTFKKFINEDRAKALAIKYAIALG